MASLRNVVNWYCIHIYRWFSQTYIDGFYFTLTINKTNLRQIYRDRKRERSMRTYFKRRAQNTVDHSGSACRSAHRPFSLHIFITSLRTPVLMPLDKAILSLFWLYVWGRCLFWNIHLVPIFVFLVDETLICPSISLHSCFLQWRVLVFQKRSDLSQHFQMEFRSIAWGLRMVRSIAYC